MTKYILLLITILITLSSIAQTTKVRGTITDSKTKEAVPFVNLIFKGTSTGNVSDFEGVFFLESTEKVDSLQISCLGYKEKMIIVELNAFQELKIELEPQDNVLDEIVVHAGENPANIFLRKVIKSRKKNNPKNIGNIKYELYNKMEFDINNFDEKYKKSKALRNFQFIFEYADTSVETGKVYLPVFITEALSDYYYQKSPEKRKEVIKATQTSGVKNESISQFTGQMYLDVNMYKSFISIAQKPFVSPIATQALLVYEYYLVDSAFIDNNWCYNLTFKPRRKHEYTFTGNMWIHDTTFAVQKINARISKGANLNYLNDVIVSHEFQKINDTVWFLKEEKLFMDFNLTDKTTGVFGKKTTSRKNIELNVNFEDNFFENNVTYDIVVNKNAKNKEADFWAEARHSKLTKKEQDVYNMVDSIKSMPTFKSIITFVKFITTGHYVTKYLEFGPYSKLYSYNDIEGSRVQFGMRTSNEFSKKTEYSGFLAYGFKDKEIKYGLGYKYKLSHEKWQFIGVNYKNDLIQLSKGNTVVDEKSILTTLFSTSPDNNLLWVSNFSTYYEGDWFKGFSFNVKFTNKIIYPSTIHPFAVNNDFLRNINTSSVSVGMRYAKNEKTVKGQFSRIELGSRKPILIANFSYSPKGLFENKFEIKNLNLQIQHKIFMGVLGLLKYTISAGKIWGQVPYPLLKLHEGSETYTLSPGSYNLMNYYEFASDQYVSIFAEHHFQGIFLNRIPLLRKLQFREVIFAKGVMGSLQNKNTNVTEFPANLSGLSKPYYEAGVGVENILKVFRLDAIWRLSHLDKPNVTKFGVRLGIQIIL